MLSLPIKTMSTISRRSSLDQIRSLEHQSLLLECNLLMFIGIRSIAGVSKNMYKRGFGTIFEKSNECVLVKTWPGVSIHTFLRLCVVINVIPT
jgi:hypothetical protein